MSIPALNSNVKSFPEVRQALERINSALANVASTVTGIPESAVTNLVSDLAAKAPTARLINTTAPITGGGDLTADRTIAINDATATVRGAVPTPPNDGNKFFAGDATFKNVPAASITGLAAVATSGSATDLSTGTVPAARMPAHTGDVTSLAGSVALTFAASGLAQIMARVSYAI